jgi:hypothetical protein
MRHLKVQSSKFKVQSFFAFAFCLSVFLLASSFRLLASPVHAQSLSSSISGLELTSSVNDPSPGQTITITAESYTADIDSANITWTAGGKTLAKGIGATSVTVQAPDLGKHLTISVTAATPDGQTMSNSITIGSGSIDMILEPDGYVPPFFPGKIPVAYQNSVKIVAVTHLANSAGVEYDPQTLVYQWQENDSVLQDQSGYGKQSIVIPGSIVPRPYNITVTVSTRDGSAQGMGLASVSPAALGIMAFYDNDPLYGPLYNRALGSTVYVGTQRELGVLAVPYGFDLPASGLGGLNWSWLVNGTEHPELAGNDIVTLRAPEGSSGSSNVEADVTNGQKVLQQGSAALSVIFSAATAPNAASTVTF